jgi:hypothetical protein
MRLEASALEWNSLLDCAVVNAQWDAFIDEISHLVNKHVARFGVRCHPGALFLRRSGKRYGRNIKLGSVALKPSMFARHKFCLAEVNRLLRTALVSHNLRLAGEAEDCPKKFWAYVSWSRNGDSKSTIPALVSSGTTATRAENDLD